MSDKPSFLQPPEWHWQEAIFTAWPAHPEYWDGYIEPARREFTAFCRALAREGSGESPFLHLWVDGEENQECAVRGLEDVPVVYYPESYGDIWFRDTGPVFVHSETGRRHAVRFQFNGWGGKYIMRDDATVASRLAGYTGLEILEVPLIFEGGSLEVDGMGNGLTTRQCLLNPNRNPGLTEESLLWHLDFALGVKNLIWLDEGLGHDHTDGHIDNVARFIAPGTVLCQEPSGRDDPNREVFLNIRKRLVNSRLLNGEFLNVETIPSPGRIVDEEGYVMPASHVNFLITNHSVLVPVYGAPEEDAALAKLQSLFPQREIVPLSARYILQGGGAFHCMTQQLPAKMHG